MHQSTTIPHILVIYHDMDLVLLKTFEAIARLGRIKVTLIGTKQYIAENAKEAPSCQTAVMQPVKGKLSFGAARSLRNRINTLQPTAVFAVSTSALSTAIMAARKLPVTIVGYRGTQAKVHRFDPTYHLALLNKRVDHLICETRDIMTYLAQYIPAQKLSWRSKPYMRQWVEDAMAKPVDMCTQGSDTFRLCYIGITDGRPHKGLKFLIDAIKILNRTQLKTHLTVVGKASDADIASAPENVTFTGNRKDALHFLPPSQVFVLPSLRDASPRVIREAQACGVPCIVSDIPGARDLIVNGGENRSGILVPPGDAQAMAQAIEYLAHNPDELKIMQRNAIRNIDANYALNDYVNYFTEVFAPQNIHPGKPLNV